MKKSVLIITLGTSIACAPFFTACGSGSSEKTDTTTTASAEPKEDSHPDSDRSREGNSHDLDAASGATPLSEGWMVNTDTKAHDLTTGDNLIFEAATKDTEYANLVPIAHVGDNLDDTIQYAFLCLDKDAEIWCILNIEQSMDGNTSKVFSRRKLNPNYPKTADDKDLYTKLGSWSCYSGPAAELPDGASKYLSEAVQSNNSGEYTPIALLSTKDDNGKKYRILCSAPTDGNKNNLFVVDVYVNPQDKAEITDSCELWFLKYVTAEKEKKER